MFIETLFPPIPSELVLPFAGFAAAEGYMSLPLIVIAGTIGAMLGTLAIYGLAHLLHEDAIGAFVQKRGKYIGLTHKDFIRAQQWFDRHGNFAVFLCRLLPGIRSLISIPAGIRRMKFSRFFIFSLLGTIIWNSILGLGGYLLGDNYDVLESSVASFGKVVYVVCAVLIVLLLVYRLIIVPRRKTAV